jgi:hypothetical protein
MPVTAEDMYKCQICGNNSQARVPAYKITIEIRPVRYPRREKANACYKRRPDGITKFVRTDDPGGIGSETVREVIACPDCAAKLNGHRPQLE